MQLREGATATEDDLLAEAATHVARYKLPKAFRFRDAIVRSPAGKADYRWAKEQAARRRRNSLDSAAASGTMPCPHRRSVPGDGRRTHMLNRSGDDLGPTGTLVAAPRVA